MIHYLIKNMGIIFLLDGLDEIGSLSKRKILIQEINRICPDPKFEFILTSREKAYQETEETPLVNSQIALEPISIDLLKNQIAVDDNPHIAQKSLLDAIEKYPIFKNIALIPFFFNTLQLIFHAGLGNQEWEKFDEKQLKLKIIEDFIKIKINTNTAKKNKVFTVYI